MAEIFLSYRREDAGGYAGRLEEGLERALGSGSAFRDVVDLRPGEDYLQVLTARIASAAAVLVLIGPRWLAAEREGRRRLDQEDDVVRREIQTALASGKPVIPVLVGGAVMPEAIMLPSAVAGLARFQAVSLSDADWETDLRRLTSVLAPLLARPRLAGRRGSLLALVGVLVAGTGGGLWWWQQERFDPTGAWRAEVTYDWGDRYGEKFVFERFAGQWRGTASYLGYPRPMQALVVDGNAIHFETHTSVMMSGETRELTHRYAGELNQDSLTLVLTTEGGFNPYQPVRFTARRQGAGG